MGMDTTRRTFLAGAAGLSVGLAGCLGGQGGDQGTPLTEHAVGQGIDDQPYQGVRPTESDAVVVAFEDPSCSRCRVFDRDTVPEIRSQLTEPGEGTFVYRHLPNVEPWGERAIRALEATFARSDAAHWALVAHYFDQQDAFDDAGTEGVYDRTAAFLDAETEVDGEAVVADAEAGTYQDAVQADVDAADEAGAVITPTVFLFSEGTFATRAQGSVSFTLIEQALGL